MGQRDGSFVPLAVAFGKPAEEIHLVDVAAEGGQPADVKYYRKDDGDEHFVPKRVLEDIIIGG